MNNKSIKVIDDHNIDRNANVMFAIELEGSEYVAYSIERDTESNNVFVSRVLKDVDGTSNMLNIDETDKKEEIANIVKVLISTAVSNQNGKLSGTEIKLSDGKTVKFVGVSFNKEQKISVQKTYITTVKKEVTNVAEKYYDVIVPVAVQEISEPAPVEVFSTITPVTPEPAVVTPEPVVTPAPVEVIPELPSIPVVETPVAVEPVSVVAQPVAPMPVEVAPDPVVVSEPVVAPQVQVVTPTVVEPTPVVDQPTVSVAPVVTAPVVEPAKVEPHAIQPTPVVPEPIPDAFSQPLVFNASKETNLNAALGEAADATNIPVESIQPVKEFGVDEPVKPAVVAQPAPAPVAVAPMAQPEPVQADPKVLTKKAGFANSKFFMVVAVAFFLASCIFLGYEVFNYFQLIK